MKQFKAKTASVSIWVIAAFVLVWCWTAAGLQAGSVDAPRVGRVVRGWLRERSGPGPSGKIVDIMRHDGPDGQGLFYSVRFDRGGFVIVPADDMVEPVVCFSATGPLDLTPGTPLADLLRRDLTSRMREVRSAEDAELALVPGGRSRDRQRAFRQKFSRARHKWTRLDRPAPVAGEIISEADQILAQASSVSDARVPPLLQSRWSQGSVCGEYVYNYYTPDRLVCGCVATAMAQVMRYHRYPVDGVGTDAYTVYVEGNSRTVNLRGGNGQGGPYDWDLMDMVPGCDTPLASRRAIGAICFDAGASVHMSYSASGSGAMISDAADAMVDTFGYSNAVSANYPDYDSEYGIDAMMNPNLDAGNPVILGVNDSSGFAAAHAIVCDGYGFTSGTLYHHINMGWGGSSDAWYDLPDILDWDGVHSCLYNIYILGWGEIISGRVLGPDGAPLADVTLTAQPQAGSAATAQTNQNGIWAIPNVRSDMTYTVTAQFEDLAFFPRTIRTARSYNGGSGSGNVWAVDLVAFNESIPARLDLSDSHGGSEIITEGSAWTWTGSGTTVEQAVSFPTPEVMAVVTDSPSQRARWACMDVGAFGMADRRLGFTGEIRARVLESTGSRGLDFELYAGDGSASGDRYMISITTSGVYWYEGSLVSIAQGLDNSAQMHTYRLTVLPSGIAYVYRDGELLAIRLAHASTDAMLGAYGPYMQFGDGTSGSKTDFELEYVAYDVSGPFQYQGHPNLVDYEDLDLLSDNWLLDESMLGVPPDPCGLVIHYRFNENSGLIVEDISGNGFSGRLTSSSSWDPSGWQDGCIRFNGDVKVMVPGRAFDTIDTAATICLWVNGDPEVQPDQNWAMIFNGQSNASWRTLACHCPDKYGKVFLDMGRSDNDDRLTWGGTLSEDWEGRWNHYAFVKDSTAGVMRIYINGIAVAERTDASLAIWGIDTFTIGSGYNPSSGTSYPYYGRLDDFRLYDRALPAEQIELIANEGRPVELPSDLDGSGLVNFNDYAIMANNWLQEQPWP